MKNIIIIGFTSTGKSSVGAALAQATGRAFVDLDRELEIEHQRRSGRVESCRSIFESYGEMYFSVCEFTSLEKRLVDSNQVIATGGHAALCSSCRDLLVHDMNHVVYLTATPEVIFSRMQAKGIPAYMKNDPTLAAVQKFVATRDPLYTQLAHVTLDVSTRTIEESVQELKRLLHL